MKKIFLIALFLLGCENENHLKQSEFAARKWAEERHLSVDVVVCRSGRGVNQDVCDVVEKNGSIRNLWCWDDCLLRISGN